MKLHKFQKTLAAAFLLSMFPNTPYVPETPLTAKEQETRARARQELISKAKAKRERKTLAKIKVKSL